MWLDSTCRREGTSTCSNGLLGYQDGPVCCAANCGQCGSTGCGSIPGTAGASACCSSTIAVGSLNLTVPLPGWLVLADAALLFLLAWACRSSIVRGGFTQGSPVDAPSLLLTVPLLLLVVVVVDSLLFCQSGIGVFVFFWCVNARELSSTPPPLTRFIDHFLARVGCRRPTAVSRWLFIPGYRLPHLCATARCSRRLRCLDIASLAVRSFCK